MAKQPPFAISFADSTLDHLSAIDTKYHGLVAESIESQLSHHPHIETKNRKSLRLPAPFDATWELRCGPQNRFRVLYSFELDSRCVIIKGICVKEGNRLICGGEEVGP